MKTTIKLLNRPAAQKLVETTKLLRERGKARIKIGNQWEALEGAEILPTEREIQDKRLSELHGQASAWEAETARETYDLNASLWGDVGSLIREEKTTLKTRFVEVVAPWLEEINASAIFAKTRHSAALDTIMSHERIALLSEGPECVLNRAERLLGLARNFDEKGSFLPEELSV